MHACIVISPGIQLTIREINIFYKYVETAIIVASNNITCTGFFNVGESVIQVRDKYFL